MAQQARVLDSMANVCYTCNMSKLLTLSPQNLHTLVRKEVVGVMREVLSDPDTGLELTRNFIRRLKKSGKDKKAGKVTPLSQVLKQHSF